MQLQSIYVAALLPVAARCVNVVLSNDVENFAPYPFLDRGKHAKQFLKDGWAEINIRAFYDSLTNAGESVIISAPAENESGKGSSDAPAKKLTKPCEYNSCPSGSPAEGNNASMPRFNYVNSYPVTSMRYGIQTLSPQYFGGAPDIAVAGFNVGANLGLTVLVSGTIGAATEASKEGIPAIAFSGSTGSQTAWDADPETYEQVYADLSTNVTQSLVASGTPYLPQNIWLNVNYPDVSDGTCDNVADYGFVLSRIYVAVPGVTGDDVVTCGNGGRLPTESTVVGTSGCFASISVGEATKKADVDVATQQIVLDKLSSILSCLPS